MEMQSNLDICFSNGGYGVSSKCGTCIHHFVAILGISADKNMATCQAGGHIAVPHVHDRSAQKLNRKLLFLELPATNSNQSEQAGT